MATKQRNLALDLRERELQDARAELAALRERYRIHVVALVNIHRFVRGTDCEPELAIGCTTGAVSDLKARAERAEQELAALREQARMAEANTVNAMDWDAAVARAERAEASVERLRALIDREVVPYTCMGCQAIVAALSPEPEK